MNKPNEEDLLKLQKVHQKASFEWLSKALNIDELKQRMLNLFFFN